MIRHRRMAATAPVEAAHDREYPWLAVGKRILHKAFGVGTVQRLVGTDSMRTVVISFADHEKEMLVAFATVHMSPHA